MIAREFFADQGATGLQGAAEPTQETELGDADQALGEGDNFGDLSSFDV